MKLPAIWVIWGALVTSVVAYTGLAVFLRSSVPPEVNPALPLMTQVFGGVALMQAAASFVLRPMLARMPMNTYFIVRWVLIESVALLGFVLAFLGAELNVLYAFTGVAFLVLLLNAPTEDQIQRYEELRPKQP